MKGDRVATTITLQAVGVVRSPYDDFEERDWTNVESEIVIEEELVGGLQGIEEFADIVVVFFLHKFKFDLARDLVNTSPRATHPVMGIFATRTNRRPNAIGTTTVRLLGVKGNVLHVKGLDALDGSPVLDVKPYTPPIMQRSIPLPEREPEI